MTRTKQRRCRRHWNRLRRIGRYRSWTALVASDGITSARAKASLSLYITEHRGLTPWQTRAFAEWVNIVDRRPVNNPPPPPSKEP